MVKCYARQERKFQCACTFQKQFNTLTITKTGNIEKLRKNISNSIDLLTFHHFLQENQVLSDTKYPFQFC